MKPRDLAWQIAQDSHLPRGPDGTIISPAYLPENSPYHRTWVDWLLKTPPDQWPSWVKQAANVMLGSGPRSTQK